MGNWSWGVSCVRYSGRWLGHSIYWLFYVKFKNWTFWSRKIPIKPGISYSENKKILQEWCKHVKLVTWLKSDPISKIWHNLSFKNKNIIMKHEFSSIQLHNHVWLFVTPWTAVCKASLSITNSQSLLKYTSIESVMPSNHLILCHPLLLLPSILSGGQIGASASVLPVHIQGWLSSGLTGLISLLSKGLSRVFSNITVQKHQFFSTQSSSGSNPHSHLYIITGKTIALIMQAFVGKVMSAF